MPAEANPFLGRRGIRLSLDHRDLLRDQLVAICQTARRFPTSIMIPMVSTPGELIEARQVLAEAAGPPVCPTGLRIGTMIEVPSAALKIEAFLPYVDFVSIGTNDLTQYTLAAERGNGAVAALSDALDPGVLRLIDRVCRAARGPGRGGGVRRGRLRRARHPGPGRARASASSASRRPPYPG